MNPTRAVDDASPDEWIAFERLLADLAALFANVAPDAVVPAIEQAMGRLIGFLGFDRSSYVAVHDDDRMDTICSVATAPYQPLQRGALPMQVPWLMSELRAGRAVRMSSLPEGLPDWAVQERAFVQAQGIRSQMCVPLREGGRLVGMITLVAFHDTRAWPKALVARLSAAGHVFAQAQALARSRTDTELRRALAEIRSLKERLEAENSCLRDAVGRPVKQALASRSPAYQRVLDEVAQVAATPSTVLLLGETGSGKEVLADGYKLNVTAVTVHDQLQIGFLAMPEAVPDIDKAARGTEQAFAEMMAALGPAAPQRTARPRPAPTARKRLPVKQAALTKPGAARKVARPAAASHKRATAAVRVQRKADAA